MNRLLKCLSLISFLLMFSSCDGGFVFFFGSAGLEKAASSYIDQSVPKIVTQWDAHALVRESVPGFLDVVSLPELEKQFFSFMQLGPMKRYEGLPGRVIISKSSNGKGRMITGEYAGPVEFENGRATITATVVKDGKQWRFSGFSVTPFPGNEIRHDVDNNAGEDDRGELEAAVSKLPDDDAVALRPNIGKLFSLAEIYEKEGEDRRAILLYEKALKANAADLSHQMSLARLLIKSNRRNEGIARLRDIQQYAEDDRLLQDADDMLRGMGVELPEPEPRTVADNNSEILLIPIGRLNQKLLLELRAALGDRMGMKVSISDRSIELGEPDINKAERYTSRLFAKIWAGLNPLQRDSLVDSLGMKTEDVNLPVHQIRLINKFFEMLGDQGRIARQDYESALESMGGSGKYDRSRLCDDMRSMFPVNKNKNVKCYIGVTSEDIQVGDCDNCYGGTDGVYGVISTYQFTAARNGENQNRPRLLARTLKQTLSSASLILGFPRCNNPYCGRSFPYSFQEHDAKSDRLCRQCLERLRTYRAHPKSTAMASEYLKLGEVCNDNKQWDEAIRFAREALENDPESGAAYDHLGFAYERKGLEEPALVHYRKSLALGLESIAALAYIGDCHAKRNEFAEAIELYSRAIKVSPEDLAANKRLGKACVQAGQWEKAIVPLKVVERQQPKDAAYECLLGICYYNMNRNEEAREALEKVIALDPKMPEAHYTLGLALEKMGRRTLAIEQFRKEIALNANHFNALVNLARELVGMKQSLDEVISLMKAALALQPDSAEVWSDLGYTFYLKKDYPTAIAQLEKAVSLAPDNALAHYNKALAHFANQQFQEAIVDYDKAAASGYPGSPAFRDMLQRHRR